MEQGYFAATWGDIKNSPKWFTKILLLGLVMLIPIFGPIAVAGYAYGWARDISWNVHQPLPERIFGNEDGSQYKRGFFIYVVSFIYTLIPTVLMLIAMVITGGTAAMLYPHSTSASLGVGVFMGSLLYLVSIVVALLLVFFVMVATMRVSIYGTISAGLQFKKIWAMIRYDFKGLLRIFGMSMLVSIIVSFFYSIVYSIISFIFIGLIASASAHGDVPVLLILIAFLLMIVLFFAMLVFSEFLLLLVARALGYWTRQFEVAQWGGQNDPMPFELRQAPPTQ